MPRMVARMLGLRLVSAVLRLVLNACGYGCAMEQTSRVGKVFVPGGRPTITYVPRTDLELEERVTDYLDERHKVLSVSGPTKTGKTVLLKSAVPPTAIWMSGGAIETVDDYWQSLADALNLDLESGVDGNLSQTTGGNVKGSVKAVVASVEGGASEQITRSRTQITRRKQSPRDAARAALMADTETVIVVDDFHYVPSDVQLQVARGMKDLVFDGVGLIVAAVPHRAYDVVRVEKEMTGRVAQLEVGFWDPPDLRQIPKRGFAALGVTVSDEIVERLVLECFQSPHLMQEFCLGLCKTAGIKQTVTSPVVLDAPDWDTFFRSLAPGTSKTAFDLLARGPRQRSDRKPRKLADGVETDIYGAVLRAIARTGPLTELTYEQLRGALREVLSDEAPQRHEVTRVLDEMSKIAKTQLEGEPVVDYDTELATLYISDPYFAYWLRWGTHQTDGS